MNSPSFITITVESVRSPNKKRLTGDVRQIKDNVADWYNYTQKWKSKVLNGSKVLEKLCLLLLDQRNKIETKVDKNFIENVDKLMTEFLNNIKQMEKVVTNLESINSSILGLKKLEMFQNDGIVNQQPVFNTWTIDEFSKSTDYLLSMYVMELKLKKNIAENICHNIANENRFLFYSSSWIHEPFIELNHDSLINNLLTEAGFT